MKLNLKKNKPAGSSSSGGGEKKTKRKSSRGGGGDGLAKAKTFLTFHVEKLLLGVMAAVALALVYAGFSKEPLAESPDTVRQAINGAQSQMNASTWTEVKQERFPEPDSFDQRATLDSIAIDANAYTLSKPLHPRMLEQNKRRTDPELLAPFDLHVEPGYGAVSLRDTTSQAGNLGIRLPEDFRAIPDKFRETGRGDGGSGDKLQGRFFVALTGLVPYKQQFDVYQQAFKDAAEYSIDRDIPFYVGLEIERAEVNPDGTMGEWIKLDTLKGMREEPLTWSTQSEERADETYLLPGLIMPLPPIVMRDVSQWAVHPKVPKAVLTGTGERSVDEGRSAEGAAEGAGVGAGGGGAAAWLNFNARGAGGGESRGRGASNEGRGSAEQNYDSGDVAIPAIKVENGMLRYLDFTVQPGKQYAYRVQAILDDPNNPIEEQKPSNASLETDVIVRLQGAQEPIRNTPWSEPSRPVRVSSGSTVLAGTVIAPSELRVGPRQSIRIAKKATDEPTAKLLALVWDAAGAYDVPVQVDAGRGSVINGVMDAEAVDWSVDRVRPLKAYKYRTDAIVLDIWGGLRVGVGSEDLTAPGFMLVATPDGELEFRSEMDDFSRYDGNVIPPEIDETLGAGGRAEEGFSEEFREGEESSGEGGGRTRRQNRNRRQNNPPGENPPAR